MTGRRLPHTGREGGRDGPREAAGKDRDGAVSPLK